MEKHLKHLFMLAMIFTTLLLTSNCSKEEDKVNQPPAVPTNPTPANNEDSVSTAPTLSWSVCVDPENDSVKYDVYLATTNPPALISSNILTNSYKPDTLIDFTKYYWKVVAKDNKNNSASSAVWNFTTAEPILPPGDLAVVVCNSAQTNFYGGAEVFIYRSYSERLNDVARTSYYRKATTDNSDPANIGAVFYSLAYQQYFIFCRVDLGGGNYLTGEEACFVPKGMKTKKVVTVM